MKSRLHNFSKHTLVVVACLAVGSIGGIALSQGTVNLDLERIYKEYVSLSKPDAGRLVQLDQELRRLIPYWHWQGPWASTTNYREAYEAIGVRPMLFEPGSLAYSGKLLLEAHRLNPNSHRSYTLYATVFADAREADTTPPSPAAARAYLKEFPRGPFAIDVRLALANFYSDLFNVISAEAAGEARDYKYDCYKEHVMPGPLGPQRDYARAQVIEHYGVVIRARPELTEVAERLSAFRREPGQAWHYCAD
jgi:hypothetical protein